MYNAHIIHFAEISVFVHTVVHTSLNLNNQVIVIEVGYHCSD